MARHVSYRGLPGAQPIPLWEAIMIKPFKIRFTFETFDAQADQFDKAYMYAVLYADSEEAIKVLAPYVATSLGADNWMIIEGKDHSDQPPAQYPVGE